MSYLLYRIINTPADSSLQYLKEVKKGKPVFTRYSSDAKRFSFFKAIILAYRYRMLWIHEKYSNRRLK